MQRGETIPGDIARARARVDVAARPGGAGGSLPPLGGGAVVPPRGARAVPAGQSRSKVRRLFSAVRLGLQRPAATRENQDTKGFTFKKLTHTTAGPLDPPAAWENRLDFSGKGRFCWFRSFQADCRRLLPCWRAPLLYG